MLVGVYSPGPALLVGDALFIQPRLALPSLLPPHKVKTKTICKSRAQQVFPRLNLCFKHPL